MLVRISPGYPPLTGRLHTRYSPVRRSSAGASSPVTPRLACVRPVASVHPEPGSNSSLYLYFLDLFSCLRSSSPRPRKAGLTVAVFLPCFGCLLYPVCQRTLSSPLPSASTAERDCKGNAFSFLRKRSGNYFFKPSPGPPDDGRSRPKSGCKGKAFPLPVQTFRQVFSRKYAFFFARKRKRLISRPGGNRPGRAFFKVLEPGDWNGGAHPPKGERANAPNIRRKSGRHPGRAAGQ